MDESKMKRGDYMENLTCPYCGGKAKLRRTSYVYGKQALDKDGFLYVCSNYPKCNSYVGVHRHTTRPKGALANADLRHKRIKTHKVFDKIWKRRIMAKAAAYQWMGLQLHLRKEQAHISCLSSRQCDRLIQMSHKLLRNYGYEK